MHNVGSWLLIPISLRTQLDGTNMWFLVQVPSNYQFTITTGATNYAGDTSTTQQLEHEWCDLKD